MLLGRLLQDGVVDVRIERQLQCLDGACSDGA